MLQFHDFLTESKEGKNLHLTHLQDRILEDGVAGARDSINFLQSIRDMLSIGGGPNHINLTTKWDGCLDKTTEVVTNKGIKTLDEIYRMWNLDLDLWILGYDEVDQRDVFVPVNQVMARSSDKNWVKLEFENGDIVCTEDHEIFTINRGWISAKDITVDDDIKESDNINMDDNHLSFQIGDNIVEIKRRDIEK